MLRLCQFSKWYRNWTLDKSIDYNTLIHTKTRCLKFPSKVKSSLLSFYLSLFLTEVGDWAFDHEHMNTVGEPLCNGTELVMDEYFKLNMKRAPVVGDQMFIQVNNEDFGNSDTVLSFQSTNDHGTIYLDMVLFEEVWLCPWLQSYFGYKPSELYVKLIPINPGLKNINKNYAHPFHKYLKDKKNGNENILTVHRRSKGSKTTKGSSS